MNIEINLQNTSPLSTFNQNKISESLHNYIMSEIEHKPLKNTTIILNRNNTPEIEKIIHNFYKEKYYFLKKVDNLDNYIQLTLFIIGIIFILVSEQFHNLFNELFLIAGWVVIWEAVYDILFNELRRKRQAKIYKVLSECPIIIKE